MQSFATFQRKQQCYVSCYRTISLLARCSKVFGELIFDQLYSFVKTKQHQKQIGFRRNRSATLQLLIVIIRIYTYNEDEPKKQLLILYLDLVEKFRYGTSRHADK